MRRGRQADTGDAGQLIREEDRTGRHVSHPGTRHAHAASHPAGGNSRGMRADGVR